MHPHARVIIGLTICVVLTSCSVTPPKTSTSSISSTSSIPSSLLLPLPFTPQAPFAVWDALHEEACEEAALLMIVHALRADSRSLIPPEIAEREIQELVAWEAEQGYPEDISAAQIAEIAKQKFGFSPRVSHDVTKESILHELASGNLVLVPAAGRELRNPYFTGEGPWYHALVIRGFRRSLSGDWFITNDPGTKRGEGYAYRVDVLLNAIHDWTGTKENIREGRRAMVVLDEK